MGTGETFRVATLTPGAGGGAWWASWQLWLVLGVAVSVALLMMGRRR